MASLEHGSNAARPSKVVPVARGNRRALSEINQNLVRAAGSYPCVVRKRGFLENDSTTFGKTQQPAAPIAHRPITRKFAEQLAKSQHVIPEKETEKPKLSFSEQNNEFGDCIYVDGDEPAGNSEPVPMALEVPGEEKVEEANAGYMEEVEMEDIEEDDEEEPIMDIDGRDKKNPLAVVDYVEDLYTYYRNTESSSCMCPDYMSRQFDINEKMRGILIDWLIEVHDKFDLMQETLFLTVNIIDRFLAQQNVVRKKLQLVGLVALLLACKYEEPTVPVVEDLILISDKAYTRADFLEMERLVLNSLQFNMSVPTPYVFMLRFLKAAESDKRLERLSFYLMELSLVEYEMLRFPPSLLAAAAVFTAQSTLYGFKQWSRTCEWHSRYSEPHLIECSRLMVGFHQGAATGRLTGVFRKYSASKFGHMSKNCCDPALFLLPNAEDARQQQ